MESFLKENDVKKKKNEDFWIPKEMNLMELFISKGTKYSIS